MNREKLILRDYQIDGVERFTRWYTSINDMEALIALTMGMGKTITASACVNYFLENINPKGKILWLTHREELIEQSKAELELYTGQYCEVEKASQKYSGLANIVVASVQTLRGKRLHKLTKEFYPDLIICDEAHHALALTWMQVKQAYAKAKVLNLTATPFRSDISQRIELGIVLLEKNTTDGIRMGILVPPKAVGKLELDLGNIKKRLGDYDVKSLAALLCKPEILDGCLNLIERNCRGLKSILFAASVEHGKVISEKLRERGFKVGEVYGETPTEERKAYYDGVNEGTIDVLVNNLCLDSETEVLTQVGWKNYQTITANDLAANWDNGKIWFSKPKRIIKRKRKPGEKMVRLDSRQKSIRVTEGHRMLERRHKGRYIHTESQDLIGKNWDFPVSGKAEPATFPLTVTKEDDKIEARARKTSQLTEWECKFIGCWLGDGDSDILQAEGIKQGTESGSQARKGIFHLEPYLTKTPNPLWWNFSEQQFDWFLEGYWMADGNHKQGGPLPSWFEIRGARKAIFDQLQAIAVCRGYKTSLRTRDNAGTRGNNQDEWIFTLSKKEYVHVSPKFAGMEWDTDHKDETVWCIETESTNIITRRNGFVTIMGNCLTEGFNLPALEAVIMLRPTRNAALYLQAIGRGLRVDHKNPNKKFCVIIDILDTAKRKGGEAVPMPTEDDIRMYSALNGRSASAPEVFLSWFYKADELEELLDGSKRVQDLTKLNTPDLVYKQLAPPWMAHLDVNPAAEILAKIWTPDGSYKDLTSPFRSGSAEAFKLMLTRKGWVYLPHNQLPKTEEELEEYEVEALPAEVEGNYTLQTLISQDAKLKNFILDLFDPNQSLKQQAAKCYEMMPIAQSVRNIAWFNLIHKADVSFHFIQWKDGDLNVILARDSQARVYCFQQMAKRKLEHKPGFAVTYSRLPDFVKGTSWADRPMSDKQAGYVAKILHVSPEEARSMRVSKLSASALMSNHWNKTHLKNISLALATGNGLVPIVYTDDGILPISDPLNNAPGVEASPIKEAPQIKTEVTESDNDLPIDQNLSLSVDPELPF